MNIEPIEVCAPMMFEKAADVRPNCSSARQYPRSPAPTPPHSSGKGSTQNLRCTPSASARIRKVKSEESELPHLLEHLARDLVGLLDLLLERLEARLHEVARRARQELQLLRDVEVHALRLPHVDRRYAKG